MVKLTSDEVFARLKLAGSARAFPNTPQDERLVDGMFFPALKPRFKLKRGAKVFTIGSCFARNIEQKLVGFDLPTRRFVAPQEERKGRDNGILNEFSPATMAQRVHRARENQSFGEHAIASDGGGFVDMLLPISVPPIARDRVVERRSEIDRTYSELHDSEAAIVTLGLNQVWHDAESNLFLHRMPPRTALREEGRFSLHILSSEEAFAHMQSMVRDLLAMGVRKILVTVSPVPMQATFSGQDCIVANGYSKAVMRAAAQALYDTFPEVDYFPSYEMVTMAGPAAFEEDNIHVKDAVVGRVTAYMVDNYIEG
jgi:hypothetical protein